MVCPKCGGAMKVVSFLTEPAVVDRIIDHLKLKFVAEKPPPEVVHQELLWEADPPAGFFPDPPAGLFPRPTPLDTARGPEYHHRQGQDGDSSRFRTRPRLRAEKEFLIPKTAGSASSRH